MAWFLTNNTAAAAGAVLDFEENRWVFDAGIGGTETVPGTLDMKTSRRYFPGVYKQLVGVLLDGRVRGRVLLGKETDGMAPKKSPPCSRYTWHIPAQLMYTYDRYVHVTQQPVLAGVKDVCLIVRAPRAQEATDTSTGKPPF